MASFYITEYSTLKLSRIGDNIPCPAEPAVAYQKFTISGTTAQSSAFNAETRFIRLHTDAIASYKISSNPTAVTTESRIPADTTEYIGVNPGDKIAGITNT